MISRGEDMVDLTSDDAFRLILDDVWINRAGNLICSRNVQT